MSVKTQHIGREAVRSKGWWRAHRYLLLRRVSQAGFLLLFLLGPWFGIWWVQGNLNGSLTLGILPLTDPLVLLQSLLAGHWPATTAIVGAMLVLLVYGLIGGRVYCSWVCPINPVTDLAYRVHSRLGLPKGWQPHRSARYWVLATILVLSSVSGAIAWEMVNPVSMLHRGLVFGLGAAWVLVLAVFVFDVFVSRRGWCSHLCPVGAFYGLVGLRSVLRVSAVCRSACDDCGDCFAVCPEMHVIPTALRGNTEDTPLILSRDCTNCGRCVDVCGLDVFRFSHRFDTTAAPGRDRAASQQVQKGSDGAVHRAA